MPAGTAPHRRERGAEDLRCVLRPAARHERDVERDLLLVGVVEVPLGLSRVGRERVDGQVAAEPLAAGDPDSERRRRKLPGALEVAAQDRRPDELVDRRVELAPDTRRQPNGLRRFVNLRRPRLKLFLGPLRRRARDQRDQQADRDGDAETRADPGEPTATPVRREIRADGVDQEGTPARRSACSRYARSARRDRRQLRTPKIASTIGTIPSSAIGTKSHVAPSRLSP